MVSTQPSPRIQSRRPLTEIDSQECMRYVFFFRGLKFKTHIAHIVS